MKSSKGFRSGTRKKLRKKKRAKFKTEKFMKRFKIDQRVVIKQDPSSHKGMPHPRFKGMIGVVKEKRGEAYVVGIKLGNLEKSVIARPEHLKPIKQ